jgi:hypothetical protein
MSRLGRTTLGLVLAVAGAGCVTAPGRQDPLIATPVHEIGDPPAERPLRLATVRVRNLGCGSLATGSGVVVDEGLIATNRHVVDGASRLEINTWDGRTLEVDVASAASQSDLALVRVTGPLPPAVSLADRDLEAGDTVTIAGYPGGRRLTMVTGAVRSVGPFSEDEIGDVALVDAPVRPGNSGGPVGDEAGRLVGLVYAATIDDNDALVIPVSRLRGLRDAGGFAPVAPCDPNRVSILDAATEAGVGQATLPPPPSPTVPVPCPVGRPTVELTALDAGNARRPSPRGTCTSAIGSPTTPLRPSRCARSTSRSPTATGPPRRTRSRAPSCRRGKRLRSSRRWRPDAPTPHLRAPGSRCRGAGPTTPLPAAARPAPRATTHRPGRAAPAHAAARRRQPGLVGRTERRASGPRHEVHS